MQALRLGVNFYPFSRFPEPERAIEQLTQWQAAGYNHVTIRFPDRDPRVFADSLRRFHDTVMKPLGLAIGNS